MAKKPKTTDTSSAPPMDDSADQVQRKEVGTTRSIIKTGPLSTDGVHVVRGDIVYAGFQDGLVYVWSKVIPNWQEWPDEMTPRTKVRLLTDNSDEHEGDHIATMVQGPLVLHAVAVK